MTRIYRDYNNYHHEYIIVYHDFADYTDKMYLMQFDIIGDSLKFPQWFQWLHTVV